MIGIIPLKGEKGFSGSSGLPVCVHLRQFTCVPTKENKHFHPGIFIFALTHFSLSGPKWTYRTDGATRTTRLSRTQSEFGVRPKLNVLLTVPVHVEDQVL